MVEILFLVIIAILVLEFGFDRYLTILNIRHSRKQLPEILTGIYDEDKYNRQQDYFRTNARFGMLTGTFSFVVILLMYLLGGFGWLDRMVQSWTDHTLLQSLFFFGILFIINDLINIPFDWYHTFVIEERFEFNKVTPGIFITDKLKSWGIGMLIGGLILSAIIWIYTLTPQYFWLLAFAVTTIFSLVMGMFYSELIVPLFNKQTPLPEGELRTAIEKFATSVDFKLKNIFVIDGSKRSTKANAYFAGLGPKKRIVLYDTLMEQMTTDEIVAVLAHEIGHYKHKHVLKNYAFSLPFSLLLFYLLGWMLNSDLLAQVLGGEKAVFHLNAIAFFTLYTPVSTLLDLSGNILSRKYEYQADAYANKHGLGEQLISGLKKLSAKSLSNLMPHPLYVFFNYSHPTLYQRITKIKST
ncbi:Protease HtpX [bioreactor metagenome]|jgi:STE24 endopeptidase|uniref:Protease HtpX n=1 Tax=bioreactor metagenome TaxID=1076179 RepID=A0A644VZB5_9ZZZZ|nr:M48 family metallopeptidase [Paludibacter sp.]